MMNSGGPDTLRLQLKTQKSNVSGSHDADLPQCKLKSSDVFAQRKRKTIE